MAEGQESSDKPRSRAKFALVGVLGAGVLAAIVILVTSGGSSRHPSQRTSPVSVPSTAPAQPTSTQPVSKPTGPPPGGPPAKPPIAAEEFGASVNRLFNDRAYGAEAIDAQLSALRATGATLARSDAFWEATEPSAPMAGVHLYDWTFDDEIAGALAAHGLKWLPIIDYSAPWDESLATSDHSAPKSASDFAAYAGAVAARYGPGGSFWKTHPQLTPRPVDTYEIWNEPDNPAFWRPAPDAAAYVDLYLRARDAITAVDGDARVLIGGLTNPAVFLPAMVRARPDLRGHVDGVAIHPYGFPGSGVLQRVRIARLVLRELGMGSAPLYVTEFGWTTHPFGALDFLPAQQRPGAIERTLVELGHLDCGVVAAVLYTWITPERDPADKEDWFGIHPPQGGSTPDTIAFAEGLARAKQSAPTISLCGGP